MHYTGGVNDFTGQFIFSSPFPFQASPCPHDIFGLLSVPYAGV